MANNIIRRVRVIEAFRRAIALGAGHDDACHTVGQSLGLDTQTVEWCVGEDEQRAQEMKEASDGQAAV